MYLYLFRHFVSTFLPRSFPSVLRSNMLQVHICFHLIYISNALLCPPPLRLRSPTFLLPTTLSCTLRYLNNKFSYMHTLHSCRHSCRHVHLPYRCTCLLFSPQTHNVCTILFTVLFSLFFGPAHTNPTLLQRRFFSSYKAPSSMHTLHERSLK